MTDRSITDLHPLLQPLAQKFIDACRAQNIHVELIETYRSAAEQDADYAQGRTTVGKIITNAKGGQSPHNCVLPDGTPAAKAFDFDIVTDNGALDWNASDDAWQTAIKIGEGLGLVSGSTFVMHDDDHFELADWRTIT